MLYTQYETTSVENIVNHVKVWHLVVYSNDYGPRYRLKEQQTRLRQGLPRRGPPQRHCATLYRAGHQQVVAVGAAAGWLDLTFFWCRKVINFER